MHILQRFPGGLKTKDKKERARPGGDFYIHTIPYTDAVVKSRRETFSTFFCRSRPAPVLHRPCPGGGQRDNQVVKAARRDNQVM